VYELPSRSGTNVAAWLESEGKVHRFDPELASDAFTAARERAPALRHLYVVAESDGELARSFSDPNVLQHVSVSSLPFAGILRQSQTSTSRSVLAVLDPEGDLSFARRELNVWPDSWPRTVLIGERAQRNTVLNGLRKGDVFHFAGHGMLMPGNPWASHIRVANGERITLEDVLATGRGPEIVILNGCETGSRTGAAEFFSFGLAEAFLMVGSRAVVATTRKVRDEDAAAFVRRFFGAFGEGPENSSAEAFRRAALAMTRKNPDLVGAFVLVGFR
jgi:CHAT domain-containing protein